MKLLEEFATDLNYTGGDKTGQPTKVEPSAGFLAQGQQVGIGWPADYYNHMRGHERGVIREFQQAAGALLSFEAYTNTKPQLLPLDGGTLVGNNPSGDGKELYSLGVAAKTVNTVTGISGTDPFGTTDGMAIAISAAGGFMVGGRSGVALLKGENISPWTPTEETRGSPTRALAVSGDLANPSWYHVDSLATNKLYVGVQSTTVAAVTWSNTFDIGSGDPAIAAQGDSVLTARVNSSDQIIYLATSADKGNTFPTTLSVITSTSSPPARVEAHADPANSCWYVVALFETDIQVYRVSLDGTTYALIWSSSDSRGGVADPAFQTTRRSVAVLPNGMVFILQRNGAASAMTMHYSADTGVSWRAQAVEGLTGYGTATSLFAGGGRLWIINGTTSFLRSIGSVL